MIYIHTKSRGYTVHDVLIPKSKRIRQGTMYIQKKRKDYIHDYIHKQKKGHTVNDVRVHRIKKGWTEHDVRLQESEGLDRTQCT